MIAIKKSRSGWHILLFSILLPMLSLAQPGAAVKLDKPKKYENRVLASENPTEKPLNPVKKAGQNLNTRYNFYFNSEKKINDILFNARGSFKDNFASLIPFYNYTLDGTASQGNDLDSVLMKCNDAILLHDLRNDWVDDLYLLMGRAYFYKKNFDSAAITFQYVNYAFQPRKKDEIGNIKYIGSNSNETGNVYTISTQEKKNIVNKTLGHTPARNESLLWLTRTFIEQGHYGEAGSMIETFRRDANFPKRLEPELKEIQAYLHYTQGAYDSAAHFLEQALDNADDVQEKARWEYLLAQLSEINKNPAEADEWYDKVITHTTDPIMEAYARISRIRLITGDDEEKRIQANIDELMKMVKKYKYEEYKHIIYYAAAQMELSREQFDPAMNYLRLAGLNSANDPGFRNKAYLEMSDLAFDQRKYKVAAMGYDSIDVNDPVILDPDRIQDRKILLADIIRNYETIRVEDSLLRIASMPEQERTAYVKSLVRKLRKEKGLKDEAANQASFMGGTSSVTDPTRQDQPVDIFADNSGKGDWYFYNTSMKSRGTREFKSAWGNRPNVDNWRRASAISQQVMALQPPARTDIAQTNTAVAPNSKTMPSELTTEALTANIPLTLEMVQASNDSIALALHLLGKIYREKIGDCGSLITNNEELLNRFPQSVYAEEALFGLYYCYQKNGNAERAKFYKDYMARNYSQSKFLKMINDPKKTDAENKVLSTAATKKYEEIYNSFIEGDFNRALTEKKKADSSYGENFWTPQLLYIESVYYIKQREDSTAIATLNKLIALYPESAMSIKAGNMIDVLQRRSDIETYLANLNIERAAADSFTVTLDTEKAQAKKAASVTVGDEKLVVKKPELVAPEIPKNKETVSKTPVKAGEVKAANTKPLAAKADSSSFKIPVMEKKADGYSFVPTEQHLVVLLLDKVDVVYINEARNALNRYNREKFTSKTLELGATTPFDDTRKMIPIAAFQGVVEAHDYMTRAISSAASEIFPWMPKEKYSFFIISMGNLELLKTRKDLKQYLDLLQQNIPLK